MRQEYSEVREFQQSANRRLLKGSSGGVAAVLDASEVCAIARLENVEPKTTAGAHLLMCAPPLQLYAELLSSCMSWAPVQLARLSLIHISEPTRPY